MQQQLSKPLHGLHESLVHFQQKRHRLTIAALVVQAGRVLVTEQDGVWSLPKASHSGFNPGLGVAAERIAKDCGINFTQVNLRQLGDYDPHANPTEKDEYVKVVMMPVDAGYRPPRTFHFVKNLEELTALGGEVDELFFATVTTAFPSDLAWRQAAEMGATQ